MVLVRRLRIITFIMSAISLFSFIMMLFISGETYRAVHIFFMVMFWMSLFVTVFFALDLVRISQEKKRRKQYREEGGYYPDAEAYARAEARVNMTKYKPPHSQSSPRVRTYSQH